MKALPIIFCLVLTFSGCKKESDTKKDCEINNYAVVKVNFGSSTTRHVIDITMPGTTDFREKVLEIGIDSDTIQLHPGVYPISFSSIDSHGTITYSDSKTYSASSCNEQTYSFGF